ncbi:hypothetical protein KGF57_002772 [Candida theae]|uniref:Protein YTP1-like C-terminal domain-containing protein n=1 Tax=Candida theae TaxID=1198502 RepID=A0AAD5BEL6_9ASCO|nr:uncharacterized protein KGF57_002772 [Candida theae]KAI5957964.1 hypothetical protein KGF57_002772 [Candida theae]
MKTVSTLLLLFAATASIAMDMDSDSERGHEEVHGGAIVSLTNSNKPVTTAPTTESSGTTASLEPTPHVMKHQQGLPILQTHLLPEERAFWENYNTTTYFNIPSKHRPALYIHIVLGLFSIFVTYPIALIFNNLGLTKTYLTTLFIHSVTMVLSMLNYTIFINSVPDIYPGNAYNSMIGILFVTTILQFVFALITSITPKFASSGSSSSSASACASGLSNTATTTTATTTAAAANGGSYFTLHSPPIGCSDSEEDADEQSSIESAPLNYEKVFTPQTRLQKFKTLVAESKFHYIFNIVFNLLHWGHFFYYLVLVPTGVATFCLYGQGKTVFNLLAHFIKGGVFFSYGILTLARYCGAFTTKGWAWNHKFVTSRMGNTHNFWTRFQNKGLWTMEMIESSLILFYGSTNIFLEHLSNAGQEWSAKDLQHVSIAFIFIGCGLCGVITEMKLQEWRFEQALADFRKLSSNGHSESEQETAAAMIDAQDVVKASPGYSPNPFPIITIYWTGVLMSQHKQASQLSTDIHVQWGNMFVIGCAFRFFTYILFLLHASKPKDLTKPSRPITELVVAFGLLCGGLIFMESTDPVVLSFEYYGFTGMFTLNLSLGFTTLFMSWVMVLFAVKDWLKSKVAPKEVV